MSKVYIKINEEKEIIEINSSIFIKDLSDGWIEIDDGTGDMYDHAQHNYLPGPLFDEEGRPQYMWDGYEILPTPYECG